jgi:hypothetical protein
VSCSAQGARLLVPLSLGLLLLACTSPKSDFETFCHAHERAGVTETDPAGDKAVKISKYLAEHLKTKEAKDTLALLPTLPPSEKGQALRAAAAKHGVSPCPIADVTWP